MNASKGTAAKAGRRILVIEDNWDGADAMWMLLELFGHEVRVAYDGHEVRVAYDGLEGVQVAFERSPDIVLCDIGMPGLDGYGVARALRKNLKTAQTRLIAITGYGSEQTQRLCKEAGFDRHFTKPIDPVVLARLLAR
jgi:CheY-like chemotaxis protein